MPSSKESLEEKGTGNRSRWDTWLTQYSILTLDLGVVEFDLYTEGRVYIKKENGGQLRGYYNI